MEDKDLILESAHRLKRWEETPRRVADDYADMNRDELIKLANYQKERLEEADLARRESDRKNAELSDKLTELTELLRKSNEAVSAMAVQVSELTRQLKAEREESAKLRSEVKAGRKHLFGKKSQKGTKSKDDDMPTPHTDVKGGFDGTPESLPDNLDVDVVKNTKDASGEPAARQKECRLYRLGKTYRTMDADNHVYHRSDLGKLPKGAVVIKTYPRYTYNHETVVTEHEYEIVEYKDKEGRLMRGYFPMDGEKDEPVIESVPGTHAAPGMMAYLVFNRFFLDTPVYRETARLLQERMRLSRQTVTNWLEKGSRFFKGVIEYLKGHCMEKDSIVNCDETWCRVKVDGKYRKRYVWCLVNRLARVAIYCYEDGSRGRKVLKDILEGRELRALQTDGYNVYLYLDDEMLDIDHVCCMAHVRAKFVKARMEGGDKRADVFLGNINRLFRFEREYDREMITDGERTRRRQGLPTMEAMINLRANLLQELKSEEEQKSCYMREALNYLHKFWNEAFTYIKDGRYPISNNLAERAVRPFTTKRKNSLHFGSDEGAEIAAVYHSIISTVKLQGRSAWDYLGKFFTGIFNGCRDFLSLTPQNIDLAVCQ